MSLKFSATKTNRFEPNDSRVALDEATYLHIDGRRLVVGDKSEDEGENEVEDQTVGAP